MNTKNILKTLALAMLLATACNKNEIANDENADKKGFALPVTVNVTREGDDTKATYNEGTGKLSFSTGDKLFVYGMDGGYGKFAGTLTWTSGGTFSGTITTQNAYSGTAQDYLSSAVMANAYLLPNDYTTYGYLSILGDGYSASIGFNNNNTFAPTKALAVEQFSRESGSYSSGFALSPRYAILNFTITGLTPSTEVTATLTNGSTLAITGLVTTDGSGNATFAMGVADYTDLNSLSLTVGGNDITLVSSEKRVAAGMIYNITRSAAPANPYESLTAEDVGKVIGANGNVYANASAASAAGTTAVAVIAYVGDDAETNTTYNHGLALALEDANGGNVAAWSSVAANCLDKQYGYGDDPTVDISGIANTDILVSDGHDHDAASAARNYNGGTHPAGTSEWFLPSAGQWEKMATAAGGFSTLMSNANMQSWPYYWSSTEKGNGSAWVYAHYSSKWDYYGGTSLNVRACLAF